METSYKITIPEPCHEDWNKMTTNETGRFCNSCAKSVIDFTKMKSKEIQDYFIANQGKNICGRFDTKQLDTLVISIPEQILLSQAGFHKIFLLALLITMGTTLLSCSDKNGNKQKIEKVEVVSKDDITASGLTGEIATVTSDTIKESEASKASSTTSKDQKHASIPIATSGAVIVLPKPTDTIQKNNKSNH